MKPLLEEDEATSIDKLDRRLKSNYKQYMLDNPTYMIEVFGYVMTEVELNEFIEDNSSMFINENYVHRPIREGRRKL